MNKLTIPARNIEVDYPSSYDEISPAHAGRIGEILHMAYKGVIDYDMARKLCVDTFIRRVNRPHKAGLSDQTQNYWANEAQLCDSINFLFSITSHPPVKDQEMAADTVSLNPKFCTQLLPVIRFRLRNYYGPKDLLEDLTIFEFKEASWRVGRYAQTLDDAILDELFAVLYHRRGKEKSGHLAGGKREMERSMRAASRIPVGQKFMIYLFFLGCMNYLREESVEIDGREIHFGCLFPKSSSKSSGENKSAGDDAGMTGILFQMAESGVFGNMEQTSGVSMWDVFLRLYQIHHQIQSMK